MTDNNRKWLRPTILLCSYGFFSYIKPSEPYITPFLMGPHKNFTEEEIVNQIFPVWSYSYTAFLIPIFLLTDYLKYKPIIMLQGVGYIGCWLLLVFSTGVPLMQLMQVFYGLATACEIGYYSYIYSVVEPEHYQKVTSYVRSSTQLGLFLGSALSQILVSVAHIDYIYLNVISLVDVSIGFIISWFLPNPKTTLYFFSEVPAADKETDVVGQVELVSEHNEESVTEQIEESSSTPAPQKQVSTSKKWKTVLTELWQDLKLCYSSSHLLRWSMWWALSTCGWILVVNYIQNLWETILPSEGNESQVFNGAVESIAQICGALAAFSIGYLRVNWTKWGELFLGFGSLIKCGLLLVMFLTDTIWICYIAYIIFIALYNFVITIAQFQIAVGLSTERFALVFGVNTFLAVVLNTILTVILIDEAVLGLDVNTQFVIYSGYFGFIALIYFGNGVYDVCKRRSQPAELVKEEESEHLEEVDRL